MPASAQRMPYIKFLDGLRCISILWVILLHLSLPQEGRLLEFVASHGWMGVDMFFVISGYLITTILLHEHSATGAISLPRFYVRRALRIWPAYYAVIAIMIGAALITRSVDVLHTIKWPALYLTNVYAGYHRTENVTFLTSWSLALEEQFYLLWPLLLFVNVRWAMRTAIGAVVGVLAWRAWLVFHIPPGVEAMRRIFY